MPHRRWPRKFDYLPVRVIPASLVSIGQDRIVITSENMFSWLVDSPIVRESNRNGGQGGVEIGKKVQLQPGDIVWIGKQPDRPEVRPFVHSCYSPILNLCLRGVRQYWGGRDFAWPSWLNRVVSWR
jgi:hypothetical protein